MRGKIFSYLIFFSFFIFISCSDNGVSPEDPNFNLVTDSEILTEINIARTNPEFYISLMENMKQYFDGNLYRDPNNTVLMTKEGVAAVDEAISDLKKYGAKGALSISKGISKGCMEHVKDMGPKGLLGHTGSDGSSPGDRMNRFGKWSKSYGECISYGMNNARKIVLQLIIDDGVPDRGHRKIIYDNSYTRLGAAFGSHSKYNYMCVIGFAGAYTEKGVYLSKYAESSK